MSRLIGVLLIIIGLFTLPTLIGIVVALIGIAMVLGD